MTAEELQKAEASYRRASARAEQLRRERNALVLEAIAAGWAHAQIASATGMTRSRVGQIAKPQS